MRYEGNHQVYEWLAPNEIAVPAELRDFVGGHPLVAETLARRGIVAVEAARAFLDSRAVTPTPPTDFPDMARAVTRIEAAIRAGERICVWGDFDVDGQTSTTLLVSALRALGADVTHYIPVRELESHGVNLTQLEHIVNEGTQLLLTCDTGIDAFESVAYAAQRGVDVIITDHHELPQGALPPAHAIINPHRLPETHPLATLPGVGVAYKLAEALYTQAGRAAEVQPYLDLVALGIVADVAELVGEARYLLQLGLPVLRETPRLGLQEMFKLAQVLPAQINEETIGFIIGPRLNALGRLGNANVIVDFLTTSDVAQARILAQQLEMLNTERKRLCTEVEEGAEAQIERDPSLLEHHALILANPHWPTGVVGIVASRLSERYNRPAILLVAPEGEAARGSARSVPGCHITEALATQRELLLRFGGHSQAAGMALLPENIPALRRGLSKAVLAQRGAAPPAPPLQIDGVLPFADLSLALVDDLERLAPFGAGNPSLTLATRDVRVQSINQIGRNGDHLALVIEDGSGIAHRVLWWRASAKDVPVGSFDLAYTVRANTFRGERQLQVEWVDARIEAPPLPTPLLEIPRLLIEDYRREPHPQTLLKPWLAREGAQLWAEGSELQNARSRLQLEPGPVLILWSAPPGPEELAAVMTCVKPQEVALFAQDPGLDTLDAFTNHLAGLVKYALNNHHGEVALSALAAALAQREATVRKGLEWLAARGHLTLTALHEDRAQLEAGGVIAESTARRRLTELKALLEETAAYRRYFTRASVEILL